MELRSQVRCIPICCDYRSQYSKTSIYRYYWPLSEIKSQTFSPHMTHAQAGIALKLTTFHSLNSNEYATTQHVHFFLATGRSTNFEWCHQRLAFYEITFDCAKDSDLPFFWKRRNENCELESFIAKNMRTFIEIKDSLPVCCRQLLITSK